MDYNSYNNYNSQPGGNTPQYGSNNSQQNNFTAQPSDAQSPSHFEENSSVPPLYPPNQQNYTYIPRGNDFSYAQPQKKQKKSGFGLGAAAILVAVCVALSGGAAFAGTYFGNSLANGFHRADGNTNGNASASRPSSSNGTPSVIFEAYENENREPGTYNQVADSVAPTVVEITTETVVTESYFWGGNYVTSGAGSGVIISSDGLIITNNHVVSGANTITVRTNDGTDYEAKVIGSDSESDIAVIKIEAENLPCALLGNSDNLAVGDEVVAVGNPLGNLGGTVTNGIVSALSREVDIDGVSMTLIQTNAEVNPGNSGGGLFNMYGELVGIVNAKSTTSSSGVSVEGIGFAIPINTAKKVAEELSNYGYVRGRVMLGIQAVDVTNAYDAMYYRVNALGVYITSSEYTDDLKAGDRIVAINGQEVTYTADIKSAIKDCEVGDVITVKVVRNGKYIDVDVTLREYVPSGNETDTEQEFEANFGVPDIFDLP